MTDSVSEFSNRDVPLKNTNTYYLQSQRLHAVVSVDIKAITASKKDQLFSIALLINLHLRRSSKMIVFKFNLRLWEVCGVYLSASSTMWNHFLSISSVLVILGGLTLFFWRSLAYILAEQNNLNTAKLFYPVMQIGAISTLFGPYVSAVFVRSSFSEMVKMLQQVVDKSNFTQISFTAISLFRKMNIHY